MVEGSPSGPQPSPTVRTNFQKGELRAFLATLPIDPGRERHFATLREAHKNWAATVGRSPATDTSLGMALRAAGFVARKTGSVMVYRDCRTPVAQSA